MKLTGEQIKKFQEIYKKNFGKDVTRKDALELGIKLVRLLRIISENYEINKKKI
jgi:hypothetical protein